MKRVIKKTWKIIAQILLYVLLAASTFCGVTRICLLCKSITEFGYDDMRVWYCIPLDHMDLLIRKNISGLLCPGCTTSFGIVGAHVSRDNTQGIIDYETVKMGRYPQQKREEDPIEWLVIDEKCGRTLLLSKYYLDAVPYDNKLHNISWAESQLRRWLNDDFYHSAFNEEEQKEIKTSLIESEMHTCGIWSGEADPSRMTKDKLFVLDPHEKIIYLMMTGNDYYSEPTEYAKKRAGSDIEAADWSRFGAVPNIDCQKYWGSWPANGKRSGDYYLKDVYDPKEDDNYILYVRPAMWVDSGYVRKLKERQ